MGSVVWLAHNSSHHDFPVERQNLVSMISPASLTFPLEKERDMNWMAHYSCTEHFWYQFLQRKALKGLFLLYSQYLLCSFMCSLRLLKKLFLYTLKAQLCATYDKEKWWDLRIIPQTVIGICFCAGIASLHEWILSEPCLREAWGPDGVMQAWSSAGDTEMLSNVLM